MLVVDRNTFPSKATNAVGVRIDFQIKSTDLIGTRSRLRDQDAIALSGCSR
jgi:hypothetical protein